MLKRIFISLVIATSMGMGGVFAAVGTTALNQVIIPGTLTITAPATATFASKNFSFDGQVSADNALGIIGAMDARGSRVGWKIDVNGSDWYDGANNKMQYNGDGKTTGQLFLNIPGVGDVKVVAGDSDLSKWTFGTDKAFSPAVPTINMVSVPIGTGSGSYSIANTKASQFIPAQQQPGSYKTTLTYTIL